WLEGLDAVLNRLQSEIRRELGREPDSGDLLLVLASASDTTVAPALRERRPRRAARALREREADLDALWGRIQRAREDGISNRKQLRQRIAEASAAKHKAIGAK